MSRLLVILIAGLIVGSPILTINDIEKRAIEEAIEVYQDGGSVIIDNGEVSIIMDLESGKMDFAWYDGGMQIFKGVASAEVNENWIYSSSYPEATWDELTIEDEIGLGKRVDITFSAEYMPHLIESITIYWEERFIILELGVFNSLETEILIRTMRPLEVNPKFEGTLNFDGEVLALVNGYQSWDYAGVVRAVGTDHNIEIGDQFNLALSDVTSWWVQSLYESTKKDMTAGALTADRWKTTLSYRETTDLRKGDFYRSPDEKVDFNWYVQCGGHGENVALAPESRLDSERIYLSSGNNLDDLEKYGELVGRVNNAPDRKRPPNGWCSWYYYFDTVTEEDILSNARAVKEKLGDVPYEYIQIDDGWQVSWGDWTPNDKFPSGMGGITEKIHESGFKAGIWLAPFLVNEKLPLVKEHPDWFLKDRGGSYIKYNADAGSIENLVGSPHLCLDAAHPEAQVWLFDLFKKVKEWGYDYIKIDFLFAGAYEGAHYENATGTEAFRIGLKIIREAVGDETYILGCGAPILPGVGIFDGNRIGGDTFYGIAGHAVMNWLQLVWVARNTAARYFMGGNMYYNDPDVIVVRWPYSYNEAKTLATVCVLCGGANILSDNIPELSGERLALLNDPEVYSLSCGRAARPLDLFEQGDLPLKLVLSGTEIRLTLSQMPQIWYLPVDEATCAVALFNWSPLPRHVKFDLSRVELEEDSYNLYDIWEKTDLGEYSNSSTYSVALPRHAVQLIKITKS